jgi:metal-dependent amidase/aminoacylase/carboxypeptidase family protein
MTLDLGSICTDLHRNPELSNAEHRTAGIVADPLAALGLAGRVRSAKRTMVTYRRSGRRAGERGRRKPNEPLA